MQPFGNESRSLVMMMDGTEIRLLEQALATLAKGFAHLPSHTEAIDRQALAATLEQTALRLRDNYPYHHPLYMGQMLKPPHPVAQLAYALAMSLNPNNHAQDGGRASSAMECEAVEAMAGMFGWGERHLGHLTSGGTVANLEALWVAREIAPHPSIAASVQAHYTHRRLSALLRMPFHPVEVDSRGRMDMESLERTLRTHTVGTVVATLGTTAAGAVDPLDDILSLRERYGFRVHVDAAYGGYFTLCSDLDDATRQSLDTITRADSIVVDPHKHGLQPYGCGCILFRDPEVARVYRHDSPYTYFTSDDLHLGMISLECSRPGAAAVALWATLKMFPLKLGGEFAAGLDRCRQAALSLHGFLSANHRLVPLMRPELDVVVWGARSNSATSSSEQARRIFQAAAEMDLHLALADFERPMVEPSFPDMTWNSDRLTCLRACVMKSEHFDWMPQILERLDRATEQSFVVGHFSAH